MNHWCTTSDIHSGWNCTQYFKCSPLVSPIQQVSRTSNTTYWTWCCFFIFLNQKKLIEELVLPLPHSKASLTVARQRGQLCSLSQERGWWTVDKHIFPKLVFALKSFDNICEKIQTFASKHGGIGCKRGGCNPVCKGRERNPAIYSMALSVASAYLADRTGAGLGSLLHRGSSAPLLATHLHKYIGSHHSESHLLTPSKAFVSCLKVFSIAPFLADK